MMLLVVLRVFPFTPRYIIPIAGMMVGNSMTTTGVTLRRLRDDLKIQQSLVSSIKNIFLAHFLYCFFTLIRQQG